jgi:hypothetical protein
LLQLEETISLDLEETWPKVVADILAENFPVLAGYESRRAYLDGLGTVARLLLVQPENSFRAERDRVIGLVDKEIRLMHLTGYHCTHLTDDEASTIRDFGLCLLTRALIEGRIKAREQSGDISGDLAARFRALNSSDEAGRRDMIWFIFSKSLLREEDGVGALLRFWGGEALYRRHDHDKQLAAILSGIGVPTIIEAAVPVNEIETFMTVGERVVAAYLGRRNVQTQTGPEMEGYIGSPVSPRRLIKRDDPEFEELTGCSTWGFAI